MKKEIVIGSRGSDLALWQANYIQKQIKEYCNLTCTIKIIKTTGDQIQHLSFDKMEGKGFFTKEIEQALLNEEIDLAVHSYKDLETKQPPGLCIATTSYRANPSDLLLIRKESLDYTKPFFVKENGVVGTSSARRKSQIRLFRPDVKIKDIRGNVPTRISKLKEGQFDAILLAKAGVDRLELDLSSFYSYTFNPQNFIPAPAQGVLAIQTRSSDVRLIEALQSINDQEVEKVVHIERSILKGFNAGCQVPLGVYSEKEGNTFKLWVSKSDQWNNVPKQIYLEGKSPEELIKRSLSAYGQQSTKKSIFITKDLNTESVFQTTLEANGYELTGQSCIHTSPVKFDASIPSTDWVFFSSRIGVYTFFLEADPNNIKAKIGAIGQETALAIMEKGLKVDFVGQANSTREIAEDFKECITPQEQVLFPISDKSVQTIQKELKREQFVNVITYKNTLRAGLTISEHHDVYVFTSPSNVDGFFKSFKGSLKNKVVVSIGKKTTNKLNERGVHSVETAYAPNLLAVSRMVMALT